MWHPLCSELSPVWESHRFTCGASDFGLRQSLKGEGCFVANKTAKTHKNSHCGQKLCLLGAGPGPCGSKLNTIWMHVTTVFLHCRAVLSNYQFCSPFFAALNTIQHSLCVSQGLLAITNPGIEETESVWQGVVEQWNRLLRSCVFFLDGFITELERKSKQTRILLLCTGAGLKKKKKGLPPVHRFSDLWPRQKCFNGLCLHQVIQFHIRLL